MIQQNSSPGPWWDAELPAWTSTKPVAAGLALGCCRAGAAPVGLGWVLATANLEEETEFTSPEWFQPAMCCRVSVCQSRAITGCLWAPSQPLATRTKGQRGQRWALHCAAVCPSMGCWSPQTQTGSSVCCLQQSQHAGLQDPSPNQCEKWQSASNSQGRMWHTSPKAFQETAVNVPNISKPPCPAEESAGHPCAAIDMSHSYTYWSNASLFTQALGKGHCLCSHLRDGAQRHRLIFRSDECSWCPPWFTLGLKPQMKAGAGLIKTCLAPLPTPPDTCFSEPLSSPTNSSTLCPVPTSNRLRDLFLMQHPKPTFPMTPKQSQILISWLLPLHPMEALGRSFHLSRLQLCQKKLNHDF